MILRSYMGVMISHYNDPYLPTRIHWKVGGLSWFFSWLNWAGMADRQPRDVDPPARFGRVSCCLCSDRLLHPYTHRYTSYIYMHDRSDLSIQVIVYRATLKILTFNKQFKFMQPIQTVQDWLNLKCNKVQEKQNIKHVVI